MIKIKLFSSAFLAFVSIGLFAAPTPENPDRLGSQIYVTFDKPQNVSLKEGVCFNPNCPDPDVKLDVYYPNSRAKVSGPVPCILLIHGGGWSMGNEKKFAMMAATFASRGYVVACCTYRLLPKYKVEDCAEDAWTALKWLRENASKFGGDPSKIGVMGGSAGGHLAALLASACDSKICKKVFADGTDPRIQAAVPMAPVTDLSVSEIRRFRLFGMGPDANDRARELSPLYWVGKNTAPMRILHSEGDRTVPLSHSALMKDACDKSGVHCELITYPSNTHAFWNVSHDDAYRRKSWEDGLAFFDKILKGVKDD